MEPHQKYHWCIHTVLKRCFSIIGQDVYRKNPQYSVRYFLFILAWIISMFGFLYTVYAYDGEEKFMALALALGSTQLLMKTFCMKDVRGLVEIADFIGDVYKQNTKPDTTTYLICQRYANISSLIIRTFIVAYIFVVSMLFVPATLTLMLTGQMTAAVGINFPGLGGQSIVSQAIVMLLNYSFGPLGAVAVIPFDCLIYLIFANIPMVTSIITKHIEEFNKTIAEPSQAFKSAKYGMMVTILMSLKYNECIGKLDRSIFKLCFILFATASLFLATGIYLSIKEHFIKAYSQACVGFIQIIAFSLCGTIIEISSVNIYEAIAAIDWYLLPAAELKNYQILLHRTQQPKTLYIAGIRKINMETCVSIIKASFSYAMVLHSVL